MLHKSWCLSNCFFSIHFLPICPPLSAFCFSQSDKAYTFLRTGSIFHKKSVTSCSYFGSENLIFYLLSVQREVILTRMKLRRKGDPGKSLGPPFSQMYATRTHRKKGSYLWQILKMSMKPSTTPALWAAPSSSCSACSTCSPCSAPPFSCPPSPV